MNNELSFVCHPDPQGAVFRNLRRRDLLLDRGIAHTRDTEGRYAIESLPSRWTRQGPPKTQSGLGEIK